MSTPPQTMDCQTCQSLLFEYLEYMLPGEDLVHIELHVAQCPVCGPLFAREIAATKFLLRNLGELTGRLQLDPATRAEVLAAIKPYPWWRNPWVRPVLILAAMLLAVITALWLLLW